MAIMKDTINNRKARRYKDKPLYVIVGSLCKRNHEFIYNGKRTGKSLRYFTSGMCIECAKLLNNRRKK